MLPDSLDQKARFIRYRFLDSGHSRPGYRIDKPGRIAGDLRNAFAGAGWGGEKDTIHGRLSQAGNRDFGFFDRKIGDQKPIHPAGFRFPDQGFKTITQRADCNN